MALPTLESLRELSREELIARILELAERLERLEAELASRKKPPTSSHNSSQPPSRDQKTNPAAPKRRRHHGAKAGHTKVERPLVDQPDRIIDVRPTACGQCGQELSAVAPSQTVRRQVTELPEIKPVVIETQQHALICPGCGSAQRAALPVGLEAGRHFGPRLEATVIYLHLRPTAPELRAQPAASSTFSGWQGACACALVVAQAMTLTATFILLPPVFHTYLPLLMIGATPGRAKMAQTAPRLAAAILPQRWW